MIDEVLKTNPDYETLRLTVVLAGILISILLGVVAFFLKEQIAIQKTLTKAVNNLTTAVTVLESQNKDRYPVIERRLNEHGRRIDNLETRVTRITTTCEIHHGGKK